MPAMFEIKTAGVKRKGHYTRIFDANLKEKKLSGYPDLVCGSGKEVSLYDITSWKSPSEVIASLDDGIYLLTKQ